MSLTLRLSSKINMSPEDAALCQRVFDHVCAARHITGGIEQDEIADTLVRSFQHGVKDEESLKRLVEKCDG
jgi:hypothetical protein